MRKIPVSLAAIVAAVSVAAPAEAVTVNGVSGYFDQGVTANVNNATVVQNFDGYTATNYDGTGSPASIGVSTYVYNTSVTNYAKTPNGTVDNFAAILGGGTYALSFTAAPVLSFLAGTIDTYNSVTLTLYNSVTKATSYANFQGSNIGTIGQDGRVTFDTGSGTNLITNATFSSTGNSFEIENVVTAAPEPATWAMMILGFGLAGAGLRSRRRREALAAA